jgi:hypothetical protein
MGERKIKLSMTDEQKHYHSVQDFFYDGDLPG